jgi:hypothetical protein
LRPPCALSIFRVDEPSEKLASPNFQICCALETAFGRPSSVD